MVRHTVHHVSSNPKGINLENFRNMHMEEKGTSDHKKVTVLSLNDFMLLWSSGTSSLYNKGNENMRQILPTIIKLKNFSLNIKLGVDQFVKQLKG